jgi:hypothetical protein
VQRGEPPHPVFGAVESVVFVAFQAGLSCAAGRAVQGDENAGLPTPIPPSLTIANY